MLCKSVVILALCTSPAIFAAEEPSVAAFQAIRQNDLVSLRSLVNRGMSPNLKGDRETTPLLYASGFGSIAAMQLLLEAGADVNAKNAFDATPLMWAVGDPRKVKLLLDKGADVNAKSKTGRTALLLASLRPDGEAVARLLITKGADIQAKDDSGSNVLINAAGANPAIAMIAIEKGVDVNSTDKTGGTPLMNAAAQRSVDIVKLLLAKGANPNAVSGTENGQVKNGAIHLGSFTPLILAATYGPPVVVDLLLKAGAKVDAKDIRGMTPLHYAVASDHQDPAIVKLLLAAKADPAAKMDTGETPADWVRKFAHPTVSKLVGVPPVAVQKVSDPGEQHAASPRAAVESSLAILKKVSGSFLESGGCVACHAQNLTAVAMLQASKRGIRVDPGFAKQMEMEAKGFWLKARDSNMLRQDPPGGFDTLLYALMGMNATGYQANEASDSMIHNLLAQQSSNGAWLNAGFARAPMEDSEFSRTAIALQMLHEFSWPAQANELASAADRARKWLATSKPVSTEDKAFQILGLRWAGGDAKPLARELIKAQRPDGGWSQNAYLNSDAYATGQVLYALATADISSQDVTFQKGTAYLLKTQHSDGSWHVASRSPRLQPYFQSGFPYDHDQWISMSGTAWATIALTCSLEPANSIPQRKAE